MSRRLPRTRGRPTGLTPEVEKRLLDLFRAGVPATHAARSASIGQRTLFQWIARGERALDDHEDTGEKIPERELPFAQFAQRAARARAEGMARAVMNIQKSAAGGYVVRETTRRFRNENGQWVEETDKVIAPPEWRAAAWWLERADPEHFSRRTTELQISGPGGGPLEVSIDEFASTAQRLRLNMEQRGALPAGGSEGFVDGEVVDRAS